MKTTIIINNLTKEDFFANKLADQIKSNVLGLDKSMITSISYWSALPFLNRVIIILKDDRIALLIYHYIKRVYNVHISLQENLLENESNLGDGSSKPYKVDYGYKVIGTRTIYRPELKIDVTSVGNTEEEQHIESPTITLSQL